MYSRDEYNIFVNEARSYAPIGSMVNAVLYNLRHKVGNGNEVKPSKVIRYTSYEKWTEGYRLGVIVEYEGKEYWVLPEDCIPIEN